MNHSENDLEAARRLLTQPERLRGRLIAEHPLGARSWFSAGGAAELLFQPADLEDLQAGLAMLRPDAPLLPFGLGSNMLVRDGGVAGLVIRLGPAFASITCLDDQISAGAGARDQAVAEAAAAAGIEGLEFLSGIPGAIGGAVRMNAGAFGRQISDCLVCADYVDRAGRLHRAPADALGLRYRGSALPTDAVVVGAILRGRPGSTAAVRAEMARIDAQRRSAQPTKGRTGGSTFKNPTGDSAWRVVERVGGRGLRLGGAAISIQHSNFLINDGRTTAAMIEDLGEELIRRAREAEGVALEWEIAIVGAQTGREIGA